MKRESQPIDELGVQRLKTKVQALDRSEAAAAQLRLDVGRELVRLRDQWPARGPLAAGWGELLDKIGLKQQRAWELMTLAGWVQQRAEQGHSTSAGEISVRRAIAESKPRSKTSQLEHVLALASSELAKAWRASTLADAREHIAIAKNLVADAAAKAKKAPR